MYLYVFYMYLYVFYMYPFFYHVYLVLCVLVADRFVRLHCTLPFTCSGFDEAQVTEDQNTSVVPQPTVIPGQDSLIITDDLLNMSLGGGASINTAPAPHQQGASAGMDLLGDGLDSLVSHSFVRCCFNISYMYCLCLAYKHSCIV